MVRLLCAFVLLSLLLGCQCAASDPCTAQTDILRDTKHKKLLVEVITIGCPKPDPAALDYLRVKIEKHCHKEKVMVYVDHDLPYSVAPTLLWDEGSLAQTEQLCSRFRTTGDTLVVRVMYIAGVYSRSPSTRGLAYGDYSYCIFRNTFDTSHERAVLLHEFGHLIGLVNVGTPMTSEHNETDPEHKPHCRNQDKGCVMYWSAPTVPEPDFDAACKQDIVANGGKD